MSLERFVKDVVWLFGNQVKSITLFGSTVTGEWHARLSDHNVMIVLDTIGQEELAKLSTILSGWTGSGNPPPLLMTPGELEQGADVYPMEYLDFKEHHRVLHGENLIVPLQVSRTNLRHECEHELRGKLLKFRQTYAAVADRPEEVKELLTRSWSTFAIIGRSVLRLADQPVPPQKMGTYEALARLVGGKIDVFKTIHTIREDPWASVPIGWAELTRQFLAELGHIVEYVDRLGLKATA